MKRFLSTKYSAWAFDLSMFLLRFGLGVLMIPHGYDKMVNFSKYRDGFMNFMGLGNTISLGLAVFAEFFCAMFIIMGLFTRLTVIPLIITMCVVVFMASNGEIFGDGEHGSLYLVGFLVILLCGPGKASVDGIMGK
jgi:putative oxidoreductase